ncbi:MAG: dethiobiotin synthase [Verrucomicrobiota bacterium]|jgi:dethiobiotin synthetase
MAARRQFLAVTGTGTGVGKTVLSALLVRRCVRLGRGVRAFKPLCSGGRGDALALEAALGGSQALEIINPWQFAAPLSPSLAARLERRTVTLAQVADHLRRHSVAGELALVEGAGGLLSPLTVDGDNRDLILRLGALPLIVASNRLGVIHDVRAALGNLPPRLRNRAPVVLMAPAEADASTAHNARSLGEFLEPDRIVELPRVSEEVRSGAARPSPALNRRLDRILALLGPMPS